MKFLKFWKKPIAALLSPLMFWTMFLVYAPAAYAENPANETPLITLEAIDRAADGASSAKSKRDTLQCKDVPYANLLENPVDRGFQPSTEKYKILVNTEEYCGKMLSGEKGIHGWERYRFRKGLEHAVPKDGRGDIVFVACGNPVVPEATIMGKYFECQICPPSTPAPTPAATVQPGLTRADLEEFYSRLEQTTKKREEPNVPPPSDNRWFCVEGGWRTGLCVALALAAGYGIHEATSDKDEGCKDCCPTCPKRIKPGSVTLHFSF